MIRIFDFHSLVPPENPTKKSKVLHSFCCGLKHTRFDAERTLHDHTLNSTISELTNTDGVLFNREWVWVPNFLGARTRCRRYSLNEQEANLRLCYSRLIGWGYKNKEPLGASEYGVPEAA